MSSYGVQKQTPAHRAAESRRIQNDRSSTAALGVRKIVASAFDVAQNFPVVQ